MKQEYLQECLRVLAKEIAEHMNPFAGPEKPHTGDGKCAPGYKKDPKTGQCIKIKKGY